MKITTRFLSVFLVLLAGALCLQRVSAAEVKGLYQASVPVADRSENERKRAIAEGFQKVLVRVSGDSAVSAQDALTGAATSADRYVVQYGYETRSAQDSAAKPGIFLNVQYDPGGVNTLLGRNSLPLWSSNRPNILVWMAWEQGLDRELVNANTMPGPFQLLQGEGARRGVELTFPPFDPDDQSHVSLGDIWGMFPEPVMAASERYQTPVVVMAKVKESSSTVQINAMLQLDGQPYWFEVARSDTASALQQLMDQIVDKVGAHYAVVKSGDESQQVVLEVEGVTELKDFAALSRYLDSLLVINSYQTQRVKGSEVRFVLTLASGLDALEQSFRLDRKLKPAAIKPAVPVAIPEQAVPPAPPPGAANDVPATDSTASAPTEPADVQPVAGPTIIRYQWRG